MAKRQMNLRKALEQMLEHIASKRICIDEHIFVLSDKFMLRNWLFVKTLEEAGCIQFLGVLNHMTGARYQRAFGPNFITRLHERALQREVKHPFGHKLWVVNTVRADQINPELVLSQHVYEKVVKLCGEDPQIRAVNEDEQNSGYPPWRADPAL